MTEPDGWAAWLESLTQAAAEFERRLDAGEAPAFVDLPCLPPEGGPLPDHLLLPARTLLQDLDALARRAEDRRDALRDRLENLAFPRPRSNPIPDHEVGTSLDVTS
ncbi:MAG TPA: hypothetical protein VI248_13685 [Kineosporiaceae bacterium]